MSAATRTSHPCVSVCVITAPNTGTDPDKWENTTVTNARLGAVLGPVRARRVQRPVSRLVLINHVSVTTTRRRSQGPGHTAGVRRYVPFLRSQEAFRLTLVKRVEVCCAREHTTARHMAQLRVLHETSDKDATSHSQELHVAFPRFFLS